MKQKINHRVFYSYFHTALLGSCLFLVSSCTDTSHQDRQIHMTQASLSEKKLKAFIAEHKGKETTKGEIAAGIEAMLARNYKEAGACFNRVLANDPTNALVHYLNGLNYQLQVPQDINQLDLAQAGFDQALKFDPALTPASLQLGRVYKTQKKYSQAQAEFANVLIYEPGNGEALYELAVTSYLTGDLRYARALIERYVKKYPDRTEGWHSASVIRAATGDAKGAQQALRHLKQKEGKDLQARLAQRRVLDWKKLYDRGFITLAQATPEGMGSSDPAGTAPSFTSTPAAEGSGTASAAATPVVNPVGVVIDAVVLRNSTVDGSSKGNNILKNFSVTLAPGTHLYGRSRGQLSTRNGGSPDISFTIPGIGGSVNAGGTGSTNPFSTTRLFAQGVSFGSINYSLNIANVSRETIQILNRPSVTTIIGQKGEFFSGFDYVLGLGGQYGGSISRTPIGIELSVTPTAYDPVTDTITMEIRLYGSLISSPLNINVTQQFAQFSVSRVFTTVTMKMGETLMLGGIQTRSDTQTKDGFPLLQDIPVVQYLFSEATTSSERKAVSFLITARLAEKNKSLTQAEFINERNKERHVLSELEMRNKDWFKSPYPNWVSIYRMLDNLYREFRTGDVPEIHWEQHLESQFDYLESFLFF